MKALVARCGLIALSGLWTAACAASPTTPPSPTLEPSTTLVLPPSDIDPLADWIEVDLVRQVVVLHADGSIVSAYAAASGRSDIAGAATPPGLFRVQILQAGPVENVPGVYVSDIVIFDAWNGIRLHSRPMDADGGLLDETLGEPATAGCVRVGDSAAVYQFARLGMWVWIH
jgi:hypothetical protein